MMRLNVKEITMVSLFTAMAVVAAMVLRFGGAAVVPYSLLPLVAILAGSLLGGRLAALSIVVYILLGLVGIPVFAKPPYGGLTYIFQPTFGFLPGFAIGAYIIGKVLEKWQNRTFIHYLFAALIGLIIMYVVGLPYLYIILNFYLGKTVSVAGVLKIGFLPFILFDLGKAVIAAMIARPVADQVRFLYLSRR